MAYVYKKRKKWGAQIRMKSISIHKVFTSKALASQWANKTETDIINGTYQDNNELIRMSVMDLLSLYYDHKKHTTDHAQRLSDELNKISR